MMDIPAYEDWKGATPDAEKRDVLPYVNEATYVGKKHSMQLEEMRVIVGYMCDNISESPDFESTKAESEKAIEAITEAFTAFTLATKKAMSKIGTNYAGV